MGTQRRSADNNPRNQRAKTLQRAAIFSVVGLMLVFVSVSNSMLPSAYAANTLTVKGLALDGKALGMWITVQSNGSTVKTGFTPLTFSGNTGQSYSVTAHDYSKGSIFFDHWADGSTNKKTTVTLNSDVALTAYYKTPASASHSLTVNAYDQNDNALNMYTTIREGSTTVKSGFAPLTFKGTAGTTYSVTVSDYGSISFDHWENGSTSRTRTMTLSSDMAITAHYEDTTVAPSSSSDTTSSSKTGAFVALYMYPGSKGSVHWQKVIDEKNEHPSVPVVAVFNPSNGPGNAKDNNIASWVAKLQSAGVVAIGYTYDDYGTRSLSALKADVDKYVNWYNADGLFIDEFTNKPGYERHYSDVTAYAKSQGMKMTMGNPGTDVPPSYIGTVDVINTSEGRGYTSLTDPNLVGSTWVSGGYAGWHMDYDKSNFALMRYDIDNLDTSYISEVSKLEGLVYITDGSDADGRWFHLPPYFDMMMDALDR